MRLTQKLLSYLYSKFDKDPERFLALRLQYDGQMVWRVDDAVLYTSVAGGTGENLALDLTEYTLSSLSSHIAAQDGYSVVYSDEDRSSRGAIVLIDDTNDPANSNGDHLYAYDSLLWSFVEAYAVRLREAALSIVEMLKQMVLWTAGGVWIDEWGNRFGIRRGPTEQDTQYQKRIIQEVLQVKSNNLAIEDIIYQVFGLSISVIDIDSRGDNLLITNDREKIANSSEWVCGPEYFSLKQDWLTNVLGFTEFSPGRFPYGGFPLWLSRYNGAVTPIELTSAFAVIFHMEDVTDINIFVFRLIVRIVSKYRAAGTLPIYFGKFGNLLHTNVLSEVTNESVYLCGPRLRAYSEITVLDSSINVSPEMILLPEFIEGLSPSEASGLISWIAGTGDWTVSVSDGFAITTGGFGTGSGEFVAKANANLPSGKTTGTVTIIAHDAFNNPETVGIEVNVLPAIGLSISFADITLPSYAQGNTPTSSVVTVTCEGGSESWSVAITSGPFFIDGADSGVGSGSFTIEAEADLLTDSYSGFVELSSPDIENSPQIASISLTVT